jgi:RHS repeat-associated protein
VIARHDFRPFGEELSPQIPPRDRKLFTGQERDFETGLDYFYARQLRVDLGRFTTPDPVTDLAWTNPTLGATNAYGYVNNNPLGYIDPSGMQSGGKEKGIDELGHIYYIDPSTGLLVEWPTGDPPQGTPNASGVPMFYAYGFGHLPNDAGPVNSSVTQPLTPMGAGVLSFYPGRGPSAGAGVGGAGQAGAANGGASKPGFFSCTFTGKVGMSYLSLALDAVGIFPAANDIVHGVQFGAEVASAGISLYGDLAGAGLSAAGMGLEVAKQGGLTMEVHGFELIPIAGNVISGGAVLNDIFGSNGIIASYMSCFAGTK